MDSSDPRDVHAQARLPWFRPARGERRRHLAGATDHLVMRLHANSVVLNGWMPFYRLACVAMPMRMHARTPMADRGSEADEEHGELGPVVPPWGAIM